MGQPSQTIAARYHLRLSDAWKQWFDHDQFRIALPGGFRSPLTAQQLSAPAPAQIWAGFMLPDTLPLIGNQYGDWICVRVGPDGSLGELLHWYHGGGDWIPLGSDLAEVVVHDVVDHFRPIAGQMLRGAPESIEPQQRKRVLEAFAEPELRNWLCERLSVSATDGSAAVATVSQALTHIEHALAQGNYSAALQHMQSCNWSPDAIACDRIQYLLQQSVAQLADPRLARALSVNWAPDYLSWLFDVAAIPSSARERITALTGLNSSWWEQQDWKLAGEVAGQVLLRRQDLGWAFNVAGWELRRRGDEAGAAQIFFRGRHASAFSDQAVRMRTHWSDSRYGKFTIAQLSELYAFLTPMQQADSYLQAAGGLGRRGASSHSSVQPADSYLQAAGQGREQPTIKQVQKYWLDESRRLREQQAYAESYDCLVRSGWDMGVDQLADYQAILGELVLAAGSAGWDARQAVAQTHLDRLTLGANHRRSELWS